MNIQTTKEKVILSFDSMKEKFGWKNSMQGIRLQKVVLSTGIGKIRKDRRKLELIQNRMMKMSGQRPNLAQAKKPIAAYKLRAGEPLGYYVTLRGDSMYVFLDKLINISFPRTRDFRGVNKKSIDEMGNLSIGIREHTVMPETSDEETIDIFSLCVTLVSSAKNKEEALVFYEAIGLPFAKDEQKK